MNRPIAGHLDRVLARDSHELAAHGVAGDFATCRVFRPSLPPGHEIVLCVRVAGSYLTRTTSIPLDIASPSPRDAAIVLRSLMILHRQCLNWHESMHELARCCGAADGAPVIGYTVPIPITRFLAATTMVAGVVRKIAEACEALWLHVPPFERLVFGERIDSIDELVARGQLLMVMTYLRQLHEMTQPANRGAWSTELIRLVHRAFPGGTGEVIHCVELELHRIASIWTQLRRADRCIADGPVPEGSHAPRVVDHRRLHRSAVLAAQREMCGLIEHPRFGVFLGEGLDPQQPPPVRTACGRIAMALQVWLGADLAIPPTRVAAVGTGIEVWRSMAQQRVSA